MQTNGYVICDYSVVKEYFGEYANMMSSLESALRLKADADWDPLKYGGTKPMAGQYGKTTIMPEMFIGLGGFGVGTQLVTWNQLLTTTGAQTIMTGNATGGSIPEDYKMGLAGLAFLDKAIKISEIKLQIGDKKLPRINLEEARCYQQPAIIFENGFIADEETGFELRGFVECRGYQRIALLGMQLNRVPNKLQVSLTGAAIS
jgi:hypothetical protein